jgi:hypothetical protein
MKRIMDKVSNIMKLETTFKDRALTWYTKYMAATLTRQTRSLTKIKRDFLREFQKPKSKSQCITEIKEIKQ